MTAFPIGRPRFVTVDEAIAFHAVAIAEYGGSGGMRDRGLLESALAQARQGYGGTFVHGYPFEMAAAYAFHIAMNHPFVDGNKRVALLCCGAFLRMNGWNLVSQGEEAADAILSLISGEFDKASFAAWLGAHCKPRPSMELRDFLQAVPAAAAIEQLQSAIRHSDGHELIASLSEARDAIPFIDELYRVSERIKAEGDIATANQGLVTVFFLAALCRIAEDMGYEW